MLRQPVKDFIGKYFDFRAAEEGKVTEAKIHVDEVASAVASFYERIRNIVDYHEEHLLRKHIIGRVLRHRLFLKDIKADIAESLIKEIIHLGHAPNDSIPENKISEVQKIVEQTVLLLENLKTSGLGKKRKNAVSEWITEITISAIEETLDPPKKDELTSELMFNIIKETVAVRGEKFTNEEICICLMAAIERALLKTDYYQTHYRLLKFLYPEWLALPLQDLINFKESLDNYIKSAATPFFLRMAHRYNTVFYLLGRLVFESPSAEKAEELLTDEVKLENSLGKSYRTLYTNEKNRLARLAIFSVVSFFLSKIIIALAVEIPIDRITNNFSLSSTILSFAFPLFLMLLIALSMRLPSKENFSLILKEMKAVLYENNKKEYFVSIPGKRGAFTTFILYLFYLLAFGISTSFIFKWLLALNFSVLNIIIFLIFTSLVIATGIKINNRSKEINLEEPKGSALSFILDIFLVPFAEFGKWVMKGLSKINIFAVLIDLIVELPLQVFVKFLENFRSFLLSKKEEIK